MTTSCDDDDDLLTPPAGYPDPADADRGEVLMATSAGLALLGVGVAAASTLCPPCMLGLVPLCALAAPGVFGAGLLKRWRKPAVPSADVPLLAQPKQLQK